jgi:hypothetical protein
MMADGIISHVSGPWSGRRHDTHIFQNSQLPGVLGDLPRMPISDGGELMALYADPGKPPQDANFSQYLYSAKCILYFIVNCHNCETQDTL